MPRTNKTPKRKAVTLIEATMSTGIVGAMLVASMNMLGASKLARKSTHEKFYGYHLAQELMEEILAQDYQDEAEGIDSFGRTTEEQNTGDRSLFNDVDDYTGWTESPPMRRDGTVQTNLPDWTRTVAVAWVDASDRSILTGANSGLKKIQVTAARGSNVVATLTAFKTFGLPDLEACCLADATCMNLSAWECTGQGGTSGGAHSTCATTECDASISILFVTGGTCTLQDGETACTPTTAEQPRITLMESWGFDVTLIDDSAAQANYDSAVVEFDVAYVSPSIGGGALAHKLTGALVGIVSEFPGKLDNFGHASSTSGSVTSDTLSVVDNTHYISTPFTVGPLTAFTGSYSLPVAGGTLAPDLLRLVEASGKPAVCALETGGERFDGGTAPARRVHLPYANVDFATLTTDGKTIMKRAIEWAAGESSQCGDANCNTGEACSCPADCGAPPSSEASDQCEDALDNDCDGNTDCEDLDCSGSPSCVVLVACGNLICEAGEDCNTCGSDCSSRTGGSPSGRYCCGNGTLEDAEGTGAICDGNP